MEPDICITFGANETPWLGDGWHAREPWGRHGGAFRYASGHAETVPLPAHWAGGQIAILLAPSAASRRRPVDVALWCGSRPIGQARYRDDRWRLLEATLPAHPAPGDCVTLRTSPVFVPHETNGAGDRRPLGPRVAAMRIRPGRPTALPSTHTDKDPS